MAKHHNTGIKATNFTAHKEGNSIFPFVKQQWKKSYILFIMVSYLEEIYGQKYIWGQNAYAHPM